MLLVLVAGLSLNGDVQAAARSSETGNRWGNLGVIGMYSALLTDTPPCGFWLPWPP